MNPSTTLPNARFRRGLDLNLRIGIGILLLALIPMVVGHLLLEPSATQVLAGPPNAAPSTVHWVGTQGEGRDMLALLAWGTPGTLLIGLIGGGVAVTIGTLLGFSSAFFGNRVDALIRTAVDVGLTIPALAVLILVAASFPVVSIAAMGLVVAITAWMQPTRVIRSQVLSLKEREFVRLARLSGAGAGHIIFRELLPNLVPFLAASFTNSVTTAILASIGLEVLGLGPQRAHTLGNLIYQAINYGAMWRGLWWWWLPPILILICVFMGLFFTSMALDRWANPRLGRPR